MTPNAPAPSPAYILATKAGVTRCVLCRLAAYHSKRLPTPRAVHFHLLWHRDEGDEVPESALACWSEGHEENDAVSGQDIGNAEAWGYETSGTYGHDAEGRQILPGRRGRLGQPLHSRGGRALRQRARASS